MKKRILSILLTLCMVLCFVPTGVFAEGETTKKVGSAQELVDAPANGTALQSVAVQNIGPNEAAVANDLYEKMSVQVSVIKLISDIELGGCLSIDYEVTIDLNGHVLKIADDSNDRVIKITKDGHLILADGRSTAEHKFTPNADGLWVLDETDGTKTVYGGIITGGKAKNGGGVCIKEGGRLTMNGGSIVGCEATSMSGSGGGVKVECGDKSSIFEMNGGAIIGCVSGGNGGGVTTDSSGETINGEFIMNDGVIDSCVASERGAVLSSGLFIMNGGTIRNCKATDPYPLINGSDIFLSWDARNTLNGKIVTGNADYESNIFVQTRGVTIGSDAEIQANITFSGGTLQFNGGTVRGNLECRDGAKITLGDGVNNGTTVYGKVSFTNKGGYAPDIVTLTGRLNDGDYSTHILRNGTKVPEPANLADASPALVFKGWNKADGTKWDFNTPITENTTITGELYAPVDNEADLLATLADSAVGLIRLTDDIVIGTNPTIDRKVTLDLNGRVLRYFNETRPFVSIKITGDLTIIDRNPAAEHRFRNLYEGDNFLVLDEAGGNRAVKGGIITNCGIYVDGGKFTMNGGSIVGSQGGVGAIEIFDGGKFTMNNGMILGCYSGGVGALYVTDGSTFTMTGGVIKECSANSVDNGGIFLYKNAVMNANGGAVDGMVVVEEKSEITYNSRLTGVTSFLGDEVRVFHNSMVAYGLYYGTITLGQKNCRIFGAIVTYMNGETEYAKQLSRYGGLAERPIDPVRKTGHTLNWYKSDGTVWNYEKDLVGRNITLTSKLDANQYTITVKPENGEKDIILTQDYGTAVTAPTLTKAGYTFKGWDKTFPTTMPAENTEITAQWEINRYTITFDTDGGSKIAPITQDYGTTITAPANPTRKGYKFTGWDKEIPKTMPAESITIKAQWADTEKPTGEIKIGTNTWNSFLNKITFGLFFNKTQTVTITATDSGSGIKAVEYLLSAEELTKAELENKKFTKYTELNIDPDNEYIIYAKLTDKAGNTEYICSNGIVLDGTAPVIGGVENGKTYCEAQTVTITEKYIGSVKVNGTEVTPHENNSFTLSAAEGEQKITVTDKAGNTAEMTVTVNDGHTFGEWQPNGDGTHTRRCKISGCNGFQTNNCSGGKADCHTKAVCEICGESYGEFDENNHHGGTEIKNAVKPDCTEKGYTGDTHCVGCGKLLEKGEEIAALGHTGGKATCVEKAVCEVCNKPYGELDAANHASLKHIEAKAATEETEGNIEYWYCEGCGKYYAEIEAKTELSKAETVTEKLPKKPEPTSPKTGDNSNILLWFALMFISGGVCAALTVKRKKSH